MKCTHAFAHASIGSGADERARADLDNVLETSAGAVACAGQLSRDRSAWMTQFLRSRLLGAYGN